MPPYPRFLSIFTTTLLLSLIIHLPIETLLKMNAAIAQPASSEDQKAEADRLLDQGKQQFNHNQYQVALQFWQQALDLYLEVGNRSGEANSLNNLGLAYDALEQYLKAIEFYRQSLSIFQDIGDRNGEANSLIGLGNVYRGLGQFPQALDFYQQALDAFREIGDRNGEAASLNNLGGVYHGLGQFPQALDFYQQALDAFREIGDRNGEATSLQGLSSLYGNLGQIPQAIDLYQQVLDVFREIGNRNGEAISLLGLGHSYSSLAQFPQALNFYQQALDVFRETGNRNGEANGLSSLGSVYRSLGQYLKAIQFYEQSLAITHRTGNREGEASVLGNLGVTYTFLGQYPRAIQFLQQQLAIAQDIEDRHSEANALGDLGGVYLRLGKFPQALDSFQQALTILKDIGNRNGEARSLSNLGIVYTILKQYPKALESYQYALVISKDIGDRSGEANSLTGLGVAYNALGQYPKAIESYQQSLAISQDIGDRNGEASSLGNMGNLLAKQNQPELAIVFYKQSVNVTETIRGEIKTLSPELQQSYTKTVADTYRQLADLLLKQDRVLEAQQVLDLLKVQELDDYLRGVRGTGQQLVVLRPEQEILAKYNALQQSAIDLGKERSLLQQRLSRGEALSTTEQQRLDQLVDLENKLNQQFNQFSTSPDVVALLDQLSPTVLRQSLPLEDMAALRDDLKSLNAVLLYPLVLEDRLELVITTPDAPPLRRTVNVTKAELNKTILEFRQALENPTSNVTQPAQQLYDWLIKPIEADLAQVNAQTIIYAPDGQLRYIPLAALYDSKQPDGKQWLVQRYAVNNITAKSLTNLDSHPATQPQILAGAFADPNITYNVPVGQQQQSFQGLPFAGQEVKNLTSAFPNTTSLVDQAFSLVATQRSMNASNILHLATHAAFVPGAPENSFILFGNGERQTLTDIGNWSLQNIDLVVLSACETGLGGLGNGEEILGLGYQFQVRGARAVIASLWSVNDGGTQALMTTFYAALQAQQSKTEALREAQIALITGNYEALENQSRGIVGIRQRIQAGVSTQVMSHLSHPYYWAPFILIGNGL